MAGKITIHVIFSFSDSAPVIFLLNYLLDYLFINYLLDLMISYNKDIIDNTNY